MNGRQEQPVVCYQCGKEGHYAQECAATRNSSGSSARGSTHQTEQYMHLLTNFQSIMILVICCHAACTMYNISVSFLIDTGDRMSPNGHKLKTVAVQRLVGMDGIPISVRGSALIQFSISGMKFYHEFIIADHITAEAIRT